MEMILLTKAKNTGIYTIPHEFDGRNLEIKRIFLDGEFCDKRLYVMLDKRTIAFDVKLADITVSALVNDLDNKHEVIDINKGGL